MTVSVRLDSGILDAGVDDRRSVYEMNDRRFAEEFFGDGGCDEGALALLLIMEREAP